MWPPLAAAVLAAAVFASAASAQAADDPLGLGDRDLVPWPQALPPGTVPNDVRPAPVRNCGKGTVRCARRLQRRLRTQWQRLDARCDHRAPIAFAYLLITRELRRDLAGRRPGLIRHRRWMAYLTTAFSNRYFRAFRNWRLGLPVPEAWRLTFEAAERGDYHAAQNVVAFSNAHVQHDLPFAYERLGLITRRGVSRKRDHDNVNEVNARIFGPVADKVAARYDPTMSLFEVPLVPAEQIGTLELVKAWRENAWRSAERLLAARSRQERAEVVAQIERTSAAWARLIHTGGPPGHRERRDAHCRQTAG